MQILELTPPCMWFSSKNKIESLLLNIFILHSLAFIFLLMFPNLLEMIDFTISFLLIQSSYHMCKRSIPSSLHLFVLFWW